MKIINRNDSTYIRSYMINRERYYKESRGMIKLNKKMVEFGFDSEITTEMYFYCIGNNKLSPFKGSG